jgi:hypothetical protein
MHANFKLSASGESVLLFDPDTGLVDHVDFTELVTDLGYARVPNGTGPFVEQAPTFSANNNNVGLAEAGTSTTFSVYPNPANDFAVLVWDDAASMEVTLVDATGRAVLTDRLRSGERIALGSLAAGTYLLRAGAAVERLVVSR